MSCTPVQFIEELPEYEVRDGRVHIIMGGAELVMPIAVFLRGCAEGKAAIEAWMREKHGEVVAMEARHFGH